MKKQSYIKQKNKRSMLQKAIFILSIFIPLFFSLLFPCIYGTQFSIEQRGVTSIRGDSMLPSIRDNQILYTQPVQFERGEIVAVLSPNHEKWYSVENLSLLKRIVGLPGEHVEITKDGVKIDGELLVEPYTDSVFSSLLETNDVNEVVLAENEYFLLGDNRKISFDSRHVGPIHKMNFLYGLTTTPNQNTYKLLCTYVLIEITLISLCFSLPYITILIFEKKNEKNNNIF